MFASTGSVDFSAGYGDFSAATAAPRMATSPEIAAFQSGMGWLEGQMRAVQQQHESARNDMHAYITTLQNHQHEDMRQLGEYLSVQQRVQDASLTVQLTAKCVDAAVRAIENALRTTSQ